MRLMPYWKYLKKEIGDNMEKLVLKKELYWKLQKDGITVYTYNSDLQKRIHTTKPKEVFNILKHLCNPITITQLYAALPDIPTKFINEVINFLKSKNYLYINPNIDSKYNRLQHFVSTIPDTDFDNYKNKLCNVKILILGVGTGGSFQLEVLKRIGLKNFTIIDKDKVETKNLCAQNYHENDIGKYKVDVLKEKLSDHTTSINTYKTFIKSYTDLKHIVNIQDYDYIIDTMDDKEVNLQILSNIFVDYPNTKLILNGYLVQKQMSYIVTKENYKQFLENVQSLFSTIHIKEEIVDNSGSIFNALFMSMSVGKMIFDDLFEVRRTNYAYADFFMNDYFIGNHWEYNIYRSFSTTKKNLNKATCQVSHENTKWINPITSKNLETNRILLSPSLNKEEKQYCLRKEDYNLLNLSMKMYSKIRTINYPNNFSLKQIEPSLSEFIVNMFGDKYKSYVTNFIKQNKLYDKKQRFDREANLTLFNSGNPVIYLTESNNTENRINRFIHELFHTLIYKKTKDEYKHEKLVLNYLTNFLLLNKEKPMFNSLLVAHLQSTLVLYMNTFVSTQYEKNLLSGTVKNFFSLPIIKDISKNEILQVLNIDVNVEKPFHCLKYVVASEQNFDNIQKIYSHCTKNIKVTDC